MHLATNAVTDVVFDDSEMGATENGFDGVTDIADMGTWTNFVDASPEASFGGLDKVFYGGISTTDDSGEGGVGVEALVFDDKVEGDFVTVFEGVVGIWRAMD